MAQLQTAKAANVPQAMQQALAAQRQGNLALAERHYADVLAMRPDYFDALNMLGLIKLNQRDLPGALRLMSSALRVRPKTPELLVNYGIVLDGLGKTEEALAAFDDVLKIKKRSVEAHNNRGALLERLGRDAEAVDAFDRALAIQSNNVDALYNRASVLRKLRRYEEALKGFDRVLLLKPNHVNAYNNRGLVLDALERHDEAMANYDRALALDPNFIEALNNRGNGMLKRRDYVEALRSYDHAAILNPRHAQVLNNRGTALSQTGRQAEALESTARSAEADPNYVNANWNEALLRLRLGDLRRGFEKYEWRWKRDEIAKLVRNFTQPLWLGQESIAGKTILLHAEQGLGDTIQFIRYAPLLAAQGARVVIEVPALLRSLLATLEGDFVWINHGEPLPPFDLHCPLLSLPLAMRTDLDSIPARTPYLSAPPEAVARWHAKLPAKHGLRVGVVWSGNASHKDDHNRSIPYATLAPLFDVPGIQFLSLQKELRAGDAPLLGIDPRIINVGHEFAGFDDTAAAVSQMDLVISVDTSVAHLAGALGKPVWVLLPLCADWRWLDGRSDNPWYPTARLFRQPAVCDWDSVIIDVRDSLSRHAQAVAN